VTHLQGVVCRASWTVDKHLNVVKWKVKVKLEVVSTSIALDLSSCHIRVLSCPFVSTEPELYYIYLQHFQCPQEGTSGNEQTHDARVFVNAHTSIFPFERLYANCTRVK